MEVVETAAVDSARTGDEEAFQSLVERHSRRVFSLAYRLTGCESDAEEVVQETFLKAYRQLHRFESRAAFGTWLHRIALNCAFDLMRKRKGRPKAQEHSSDSGQDLALETLAAQTPSAERLMMSAEIRREVESALDLMSPGERTAFVLRHYEGLSIAEIAERLDLGDSAAKHSIFRAVKKLRAALSPLAEWRR